MTLSDIKVAYDALPASGGVIELPAGQITGSTGDELVITKPVRLLGHGMNMSDSQLSQGITEICYTGTGVPIQIGSPTMPSSLYGVELKDFSVKGTSNGTAGIRVTGNIPQGILSGRILIENVDCRYFNGGAGVGFDLNYGITVTLRRTHAHMNGYGYRVRWGNGYLMDGVLARHNAQGIRADAFNGLTITGWSVLESNNNSAIVVLTQDNCRDLILDQVWIENNNVVSSSLNDAVYIGADVSGTNLDLFRMTDVNFDGGRGNLGGMGNVSYQEMKRIRWNNGTYTA